MSLPPLIAKEGCDGTGITRPRVGCFRHIVATGTIFLSAFLHVLHVRWCLCDLQPRYIALKRENLVQNPTMYAHVIGAACRLCVQLFVC